jgi:hypothetical protein
MAPPRLAGILVLVLTMATGSAIGARASDFDVPLAHIRSTDRHLRALIDDALATSASIRALAERIAASDVVVYVECETDPVVPGPGRLNFMSAAGGRRYVLVRLKPMRRDAAIAMLAHELQHAAEIAEAPSIVDEASLAREYARMGYRSHSSHGGLAFDTKAAVQTGRRVMEELRAMPGRAAD